MSPLKLLLCAGLAAGLMSSPTLAAEGQPRSGCDISVAFKVREGKIDVDSYERMKEWLSRTTELTSFQDTENGGKARKLCLLVSEKDRIRPVFQAVVRLVDRSYGGDATVKVENRFGGLFERKPYRSYSPGGPQPRSNGINERPPMGNRN